MWKVNPTCKIPIATFFEDVLGVKLRNPQWSWGARDLSSGRIYLKLWHTEIDKNKVGLLWADYGNDSLGKPERSEHLEAMREGAECYGVYCKMKDDDGSGRRRVKCFDDQNLLRLGKLSEANGDTFARILGTKPISDLGMDTSLADIKTVASSRQSSTVKQALVNARRGQGEFGSIVRSMWNQRCAVTGTITPAALEASHLLRWAESNNQQRLDPNNGLLLTATLHKLFDAGLITFADSGKMLVSSRIARSERDLLGLNDRRLSKKPSSEMAHYLAYHRNTFQE